MRVLHLTSIYPTKSKPNNPVIKDLIHNLNYLCDNDVIISKKVPLPFSAGRYHSDERIVGHFGLPYGLFARTRLASISRNTLRMYAEECSSYEVIHAHTLVDGKAALDISRSFGIPYVVSLRNTCISQIKTLLTARSVYLQILEEASSIITISQVLKKEISDFLEKKGRSALIERVRVVPNAIDESVVKMKDKSTSDSVKLVTACNLIKRKNVERLIKAFSLICKRQKNCQLEIIGDGTQRKRLQKLVESLQLDDSVVFLGSLPRWKVLTKFDEADLFVMVSLKETFGMVYLEALARGLPIIWSENRGIDGLFRECVGIATNPKKVQKIGEAIVSVVGDLQYYTSNVRRFQENEIKDYFFSSTVKTIFSLYNSVLLKRSGNRLFG